MPETDEVQQPKPPSAEVPKRLTLLQKVEIGTVITVAFSIIGFAYWLGCLNTRIDENAKAIDDSVKTREAVAGLSRDIAKIESAVARHADDLREMRSVLPVAGVLTRRYKANEPAQLDQRQQFQFFTPCARSWDEKIRHYHSQQGTADLPEDFVAKYTWLKIDESRVDQFGNYIIDQGFTRGWRRYEFEGQGRYRDRGWWWVITVDNDFDLKRFVDSYLKFWGTTEMYVEQSAPNADVMPTKIIPSPLVPELKTDQRPVITNRTGNASGQPQSGVYSPPAARSAKPTP
jgi:hypothetical protein